MGQLRGSALAFPHQTSRDSLDRFVHIAFVSPGLAAQVLPSFLSFTYIWCRILISHSPIRDRQKSDERGPSPYTVAPFAALSSMPNMYAGLDLAVILPSPFFPLGEGTKRRQSRTAGDLTACLHDLPLRVSTRGTGTFFAGPYPTNHHPHPHHLRSLARSFDVEITNGILQERTSVFLVRVQYG